MHENKFKNMLIAGIVLVITIFLVNKIVLNQSPKTIILFIIVVFTLLAFLFWRQVVLFIPFWILVEGYIRRKYFDSTLVLFIKDAALLAVYFRLFLMQLRGELRILHRNEANWTIAVLFIWCFFGIFNPNLESYMVGILGIKVIFLYVPLFYILRYVFGDKRMFLKYIKLYLFASVFLGLYAYFQYSQGAGSMHGQDIYFIDPEGNFVLRPASTFYFNAAFSQYSYIMFTLLTAVFSLKYFSRPRILMFMIVAANIMSILLSGQRVVWITLLMQISIFAIVGYNVSHRFVFVARTVLFLSIASIILLHAFPKLRGTTQIRFASISSVAKIQDIQLHRQGGAFGVLKNNSPIIGNGTGSATPATRHLDGNIPVVKVEGGHVQIAWEIGLIGLGLFLLMLLKLALYAWKTAKHIRDRDLKLFGVYSTLLPIGFLIINFTTGVFYVASSSFLFWFSMGFVPLIKRLEEKEDKESDENEELSQK